VGATGATGPKGTTGQQIMSVFSTATVTIGTATPVLPVLVPGLSLSVTVPANTLVYVSSYGGIGTTSTAMNGVSVVDILLQIDGITPPAGAFERIYVANTTDMLPQSRNWSFATFQPITQGNHTFTIAAKAGLATGNAALGNASATVGGDNTITNQGELTVLFLAQ
jgi:hypothetical protein